MTDSTANYKTYWLIRGKRVDSWPTVEQKVLAGAIAVEISAEQQRAEAAQKGHRDKQALAEDARIRGEAARIQYERSPEGRREEALRFAAAHPGGFVSGRAVNDCLSGLDAFSRQSTNLLKQ